MKFPISRLALCASLTLTLTCTNASVYGQNGAGPEAADRAQFSGTICAPIGGGAAFPVKILFAFEGGAPEVSADDSQILSQTLTDLTSAATIPSTTYALVAFHTVARALLPTFSSSAALQAAALQFPSFQQSGGSVSIASALELVSDLLAGDMATACKGALARTRYVVVLAFTSPDTTCDNPVYEGLVDPSGCGGDGGVPAPQCVACRLTYDTLAIKKLAAQFNVGEVDVLPVYYRDGATVDPVAQAAATSIATAAGSTALVTISTAFEAGVNSLNLGSLAQPLTLKRLFAWNRNSAPQAGTLNIDSDGDGLSDVDEVNIYHTDPLNYDTDGDGIGDGVEVKVGLDPLTPNALPAGCDPTQDSDGDRLNDCEEVLLGTDLCNADTDGDGFSDLVETFRGTNPLVPENTQDNDHDGYSNAQELSDHTDVNSADIAFRLDHAYFTTSTLSTPTVDGRACYAFTIGNVGLVSTAAVPNPPFGDIAAGNNDVYLFLEMGFEGRISGEVSSVFVQPILYTASPSSRSPSGVISVTPEEFILGN